MVKIKALKVNIEGDYLKILYAASECVPFIKTGGLADVAGSLPKELKKLGVDIRVVLPKYSVIPELFLSQMVKLKEIQVYIGIKRMYLGIETLVYEGVTYYFIDNEELFKRDSIYSYPDDDIRFTFFNRAILEILPHIAFKPDIIHINDWHLGLVPLMYQAQYRHLPFYENIKTVLTIHNMRYQGWFDKKILPDLCGIDLKYFYNGTTRQHDQVNFLKTAILMSDYITTVSQSYVKEIQTPEYGEGLEYAVQMRHTHIKGILNGINTNLYNPKTDPSISVNYDINTFKNKYRNKEYLQEYFGLPKNDHTKIIGVVTRLTSQKGMDLIMNILDSLLENNIQFILLGTGEEYYETYFRDMEHKYPNQCRSYIGFDSTVAKLIFAGSDFLLIPSLFEPCGLTQMIAMRYGTIPIVRETGGLIDTVTPFNEYSITGDGFGFKNYCPNDLLNCINYALKITKNKTNLNYLIKSAMKKDFSWEYSASQYLKIYEEVIL